MSRRPHTSRHAFTLTELAIVIVILGVVAAIAVPRLASAVGNSREAAATATLHTYLTAIEQFDAMIGRYPATITPALLERDDLPANPLGGSVKDPILRDASGDPSIRHPATIRFRADDPAAQGWWYNPANGVFRALVPMTPDPAADLALYERINGCTLADEKSGGTGKDLEQAGDEAAMALPLP